jgi:membrane associated rhomboid family serine protease
MFMHGGLLHLVGNMFFLFAIGPFLEKSLGRGWFALLYFGGGILATLSFGARHPDSFVPLVGASGAIAALMGAYLIEFGRSRITMLFVPLIFIPTWNFRFAIPAAVLLPLWFLEQIVSIPTESGSMGGVAVTAHAAGFVAGLLFGGAMKLRDRVANARIAKAPAAAARAPKTAPAAAPAPAAQVAPAEALFQAFERARERGDMRAVDDIACRIHARAEEKRDARAEAIVAQIGTDPTLALPRFLIRTAAAAERFGDRQSAVERYERVAALDTAGREAVTALINVGGLYRLDGDETAARAAFKRALMHAHCSEENRTTIYAAMRPSS